MTPVDIIIFICLIIVLSYLFQYVSILIKVPSVIFLMLTGIVFRVVLDSLDYKIFSYNDVLQILGTIGLILIVLEGSLDLSISKSKMKLISNAFLSAALIFATSAAAIAMVIYFGCQTNIYQSVLYAIPLATASSAIAIPSAGQLMQEKKEFIIFETTFSDIIGILVFNFCFLEAIGSFGFFTEIIFNIIITIVLATVSSFLLIYLIAKSKMKVRFFLVISVLILLYAVGKKFHLPSLLVVLMFGLLLKNYHLYNSYRYFKFITGSRINSAIHEVEHFTSEVAFVIRTFFFILFGFSIEFEYFYQGEVWIIGGIIMFVLMLFRFVNLKLINQKDGIFPELFIAPRGLITIILYYSIPLTLMTPSFNPGIMYFVILASNIVMMIALLFTSSNKKEMAKELVDKNNET